MKITKVQLRELKSKPYFQNEGIISRLFARKLGKLLSKDTDFKKAVDKLDSSMDVLKKQIIDAEKSGIKVPAGLKKYAGM
tara:strand:+ start:283 stop:522 length:240 start_codon:yes stop_codon:yes gene_type:complete